MTREIERYKTRLLNVAKALRESPNPNAFDMSIYGHDGEFHYWNWSGKETKFDCGTPACALGHYASRRDLQKTFRLDEDYIVVNDNEVIGYASQEISDHFGITFGECAELFDADGCNNAKTAKQAAKYIERFVKEKFQ